MVHPALTDERQKRPVFGLPTGRRQGWHDVAVPVVMSALALVLASLPYLYGYVVRPEGARFWAVPPFNAEDANQYLAFIRSMVDGQLLVGNVYTAEPHLPRLFLPEALLQAALCRAFGWTPLVAFQVTRIVFGAGLLFAAWRLGTLLIRRRSLQHLYMAFVCFSAGGGWVVDFLRPGTAHGDQHQPEGNTFYLLGNLPHLVLAAALLTGLFATRVALGRGGVRPDPWFNVAATVLLSFVLSWTHPWDFLPLLAGAIAYGVCLLIEEKRIPRASIVHLAAVAVGALPAAVYLSWVVRIDPIYAAMANDVMEVQRWPFYLIAHGVLGLPALVVLADARRRRRYALPLCWVLCVFVLLLLPLRMGGKQSRLPGGVHVPLALLAAVGVDYVARATVRAIGRTRRKPRDARLVRAAVAERIPPASLARAISGGYLLIATIGAAAILHRHWSEYAARSPAYFQSPAVQELYTYLDRFASLDQVALGGALTASWAPGLADIRVYHGHWHLTLREAEKRARRDWFFTAAAAPEERASWLAAQGITWIIWYPAEWQGRILSVDDVPGLARVYATEEIILYRYAYRGST